MHMLSIFTYLFKRRHYLDMVNNMCRKLNKDNDTLNVAKEELLSLKYVNYTRKYMHAAITPRLS
jgi:hypothetical protein